MKTLLLLGVGAALGWYFTKRACGCDDHGPQASPATNVGGLDSGADTSAVRLGIGGVSATVVYEPSSAARTGCTGKVGCA